MSSKNSDVADPVRQFEEANDALKGNLADEMAQRWWEIVRPTVVEHCLRMLRGEKPGPATFVLSEDDDHDDEGREGDPPR